jgi:phage/plasmid-like protein (TIGR03299 family)
MAHELSIKANGNAEMAYVGSTPWHGLGQQVTQGASIGVWQKEAGMDWEALSATPEITHCEGLEDGVTLGFSDYQALYRSDTRAPLAIVGANYKLVQPRAVLEFFRDLTETGGWHIHTAGVLRGGRKLWAMASNGEGSSIEPWRKDAKKADRINQNLLLATSLDGSMKTIAALTAVRVVCANTLALALRDNGEKVQVSHRNIFDPAAIKRAIGLSHDSFAAFIKAAREMADTPIKLDESLEVLRGIFGSPESKQPPSTAWMGKLADLGAQPIIPADEKEGRSVSRILELFDGAGRGASMASAKGTRWGLFNALTEHVDHEMGRSPGTRLDSAWFGRGNGFKQQAFTALTA